MDKAKRKHPTSVQPPVVQRPPLLRVAIFQGTGLRQPNEPQSKLPGQPLSNPHALGGRFALRSSLGAPMDGKPDTARPPTLPGQTPSWTPAASALFPTNHSNSK